MKGLVLVSLMAAGLSAALAAGICELGLIGKFGAEIRAPYFSGVGAGLVLALVGLPFAVKLAAIGAAPEATGGFWKWWGAGLLLRMALMLVLALTLMAVFAKFPAAALLPMSGVYLVGMFAEAAWLAKFLFGKDTFSKSSLKQ